VLIKQAGLLGIWQDVYVCPLQDCVHGRDAQGRWFYL
jgi:hypothetical protein